MEVVHRDLRVGQGRANGGGVAGMRVDHHHLHPGPELGRAGGQPGLDRGAAPPVDLPQQGLVTGDVDEPGLSHGSGRRHRLRLGQLDRAMDRHRSLHRRPRHPVPRGDLGLVPPVLHRHRQCGVRSRVVVRIPAGTWATCSVNDARGQTSVRQRHWRLRHCTATGPPPLGRSCGRVSTQSLPEVERTRQPGQRAASGSSVISCTIRTPSPVSATRSTAKPSSPNRHDASSVRSTPVRGSPFAAPEHSEDQGVTDRPRSGAPHGPTSGCPVKIEEQDRRARYAPGEVANSGLRIGSSAAALSAHLPGRPAPGDRPATLTVRELSGPLSCRFAACAWRPSSSIRTTSPPGRLWFRPSCSHVSRRRACVSAVHPEPRAGDLFARGEPDAVEPLCIIDEPVERW
ncbi:MAG: hypothetical protein JWP64_3707 [Pseudonocardia sp.]|nr:hypothetical protein [Pseudonocardia sp.]